MDRFIAIEDFAGDESRLQLSEKEVVTVTTREDDWWYARRERDGHEGWVSPLFLVPVRVVAAAAAACGSAVEQEASAPFQSPSPRSPAVEQATEFAAPPALPQPPQQPPRQASKPTAPLPPPRPPRSIIADPDTSRSRTTAAGSLGDLLAIELRYHAGIALVLDGFLLRVASGTSDFSVRVASHPSVVILTGALKSIVALSADLVDILTAFEAASSSPSPTDSPAFTGFADELSRWGLRLMQSMAYADYSHHQLALIDQLSKSPRSLTSFLKRATDLPADLDLEELLSLPISHLADAYVPALLELYRLVEGPDLPEPSLTPRCQPTRPALEQVELAAARVQRAAEATTDYLETRERQLRVLECQQRFLGTYVDLYTPSRYLVSETVFTATASNNKPRTLAALLLSDALVFAVPIKKSKGLQFKFSVMLKECAVDMSSLGVRLSFAKSDLRISLHETPTPEGLDLGRALRRSYSSGRELEEGGSAVSYLLNGSSQKEEEAWVQHVESQISRAVKDAERQRVAELARARARTRTELSSELPAPSGEEETSAVTGGDSADGGCYEGSTEHALLKQAVNSLRLLDRELLTPLTNLSNNLQPFAHRRDTITTFKSLASNDSSAGAKSKAKKQIAQMQQAILATPSLTLLIKALHDATLKATHLLAALSSTSSASAPTSAAHVAVTEWAPLLESLETAAQHRLHLVEILRSATFAPLIAELSTRMAAPLVTLVAEFDAALTVVPKLRDEMTRAGGTTNGSEREQKPLLAALNGCVNAIRNTLDKQTNEEKIHSVQRRVVQRGGGSLITSLLAFPDDSLLASLNNGRYRHGESGSHPPPFYSTTNTPPIPQHSPPVTPRHHPP